MRGSRIFFLRGGRVRRIILIARGVQCLFSIPLLYRFNKLKFSRGDWIPPSDPFPFLDPSWNLISRGKATVYLKGKASTRDHFIHVPPCCEPLMQDVSRNKHEYLYCVLSETEVTLLSSLFLTTCGKLHTNKFSI